MLTSIALWYFGIGFVYTIMQIAIDAFGDKPAARFDVSVAGFLLFLFWPGFILLSVFGSLHALLRNMSERRKGVK